MRPYNCLQCGRDTYGDATTVTLRRASIYQRRRLQVCFHCFELLELYLDGGTIGVARLPALDQLKLPVAART